MATSVEQREALQAELKTKLICRFCLTQQTGKLSNIYVKDIRVKSLVPLPVQVMAIASMEVFSNDGMPSSVCFECRLLFDYSYRFKQMCKKAENLLRQVPLTGQWPESLPKPSLPAQLLPKQTFINQSTKQQVHPLVQPQPQPQPQSQSQSQLNPQSQQVQQQSQPLQSQKQDLIHQKSLAEKHQQNTLQPSLKPKVSTISSTESNMSIAKQIPTVVTYGAKKILNSNPAASPEPPVPVRVKKEKTIDETSNFLHKVENNEEISLDDVQRLIAAERVEFTSPETVKKNSPQRKPKLLNKSSIRILNKEAEIVLEPRLSLPQVQQDEDGNMSIVTEILDPNEPYETEPDPVKNAAPVQTNVFPCPHCDRTFPLLQLRDIHMVNHTRERLFPCSECNRSFFSKYDLQKHTVLHTGEKKYKCTVCSRGFTRPTLLHRHEKVHTDIPKFLCVYCEKPFLSKNEMEKHAERHRKNRPFKCKICSKSFAFKQGVERHEVVHLQDQPYPCQYCDQSFCTASKLARHLTAHAGKRPYPCKFCSKSYLLSHHLTRHMRSHKDSVVLYSCNECDKVYKTCDELIFHSAVHATVTLTCPLCQMSFEDVTTVTAHIKEHSQNEAFACEFCDLIFLTWEHQKDHIQRAHAEDMKAYQEDEKKTARVIKSTDAELEQVVEEFLEDNLPVENSHNKIVSNQTILNEETKIKEVTKGEDLSENELCEDEEYLSLDEVVNEQEIQVKNEKEFHKSIAVPTKKIKTEANSISNPTVTESERLEIRRKLPSRDMETVTSEVEEKKQLPVSINKLLNSLPKGIHLRRNTSKVCTAQVAQPTQPTQSAQTAEVTVKTRAAAKRLSDGVLASAESMKPSPQKKPSRQILNKLSTTSLPGSATTTDKSSDNVMKMKLGEKHVKVQKIVITKAEAAAMAKEGRIHIKDGNLILTQGPKSVTK